MKKNGNSKWMKNKTTVKRKKETRKKKQIEKMKSKNKKSCLTSQIHKSKGKQYCNFGWCVCAVFCLTRDMFSRSCSCSALFCFVAAEREMEKKPKKSQRENHFKFRIFTVYVVFVFVVTHDALLLRQFRFFFLIFFVFSEFKSLHTFFIHKYTKRYENPWLGFLFVHHQHVDTCK